MPKPMRAAEFPSLYERDYYAWVEQQVRTLAERRLEQLDIANLAEELGDLGRSEQRQVESRLEVLLAHLLKWVYQPRRRSVGWENTIDDQRDRVQRLLKRSPSLTGYLPEALREAYRLARRTAGNDMRLGKRDWNRIFPRDCPWTLEEVLKEDFYPQEPAAGKSGKPGSG